MDGILQTSALQSRRAGIVALTIAAALFVAAQISIDSINGWWLDEQFSLWATDTSLPIRKAFAERIGPDSNPPLYFSVLYAARLLIADDRLAILALNICFMLLSATAVLLASRKSGMVNAAIVAIIAFVLSGPVLTYAPEGRSYLASLAIVFCASWFAVLAVCGPERRHSVLPFAVFGVLAALAHVFAALFCGALAGGLLALAIVDRSRRDLAAPALVLGLSTSVTFAAWLLMALSSLGNIGWIEFSFQDIRVAVWFVRKLAVGGIVAVLLLAVLLLFGFARTATRPITLVFGVTFALYVLLPLIASLKQPIIAGRYWMIGAPALPVLIVALAAIWYREARDTRENQAPLYALGAAGVLAVISGVSGFLTAREFTAAKPTWKGAAVVRPLLKECPNGSVHVAADEITKPLPGPFIASFARLANVPSTLLVDVGNAQTPLLSPDDARCPVLAWAEHVRLGDNFLTQVPDAELLRLTKINASPKDVEIRRHQSGFVVLKRRAGG
jgi:hypothetical protein